MPKSSRRRRGARPRGPQINSKSQTFLTEPAKSNLSLHSTPLQPCSTCSLEKLPDRGCWRVGKTCIENRHQLEFNERLNASSYVNVVFEKEESEVAFLGLPVNLADQNVYPSSLHIHDDCVGMIANLWNCPPLDEKSRLLDG
ncbi:hypothetical protein AAMO2058_001170700 [Amorphochlora amoebiformis]